MCTHVCIPVPQVDAFGRVQVSGHKGVTHLPAIQSVDGARIEVCTSLAHVRVFMRARVRACMYVCMYVSLYVCMYTCIHTYIHTYIYIYPVHRWRQTGKHRRASPESASLGTLALSVATIRRLWRTKQGKVRRVAGWSVFARPPAACLTRLLRFVEQSCGFGPLFE